MDISFEIKNTKGDQIKVALSFYDAEIVQSILSDPYAQTLDFYDVTLIRESGDDYVGYDMLSSVSETLAKFIYENEDAVLCFYCDANSNVKRNHSSCSPQEYRSLLFSRMFDKYTREHHLSDLINHRVRMEIDDDPMQSQFAHFICRKRQEPAVIEIGEHLMGIEK